VVYGALGRRQDHGREIVEHELRDRAGTVEVLDGDIVRTNLSKGLGFSRETGTRTC
jgi:adenylylsulfate kinase-like enzyme